MKHMAHIVDGTVVNVSLWDGDTTWDPEGPVAEIPDSSFAGIGWDYSGGVFVDNRPHEHPAPL